MSVGFGDFTSAGNGVMTSLNGYTLNSGSSSIASSITAASNVITAADVALEAVSNQRATFGAVSNRLTHAIDNLTNVKTQAEGARSRILDTDYAQSTSELARTQIIQQAGTAMLAQANQLPATVLALLR
jgi:flagellin